MDDANLHNNLGGSDTGEVQAVSAENLRSFLEKIGTRNVAEVRMLEALIRNGRLQAYDAQGFLGDARQHNRTVLAHALDTGLATEQETLNILAMIYGFPALSLSGPDMEVEEDVAALLSPEQAREWRVLPFSRDDVGAVHIAIADPAATRYSEDIKKSLRGQKFNFVFVAPSELDTYIETIYGSQEMAEAAISKEIEQNFDAVGTARTDSQTSKLFNDMMMRAVRANTSDVHIVPQENTHVVRMRIDGALRPVANLPSRTADQLVSMIKIHARMQTERTRHPQDGRFTVSVDGRPIDVRVSTLPTAYGFDTAVLRLLDTRKLGISLTDLGMNADNLALFRRGIRNPWGLILLCGPTGSGKTTTLQAALREIQRPEINIVSIEDPVETKLPGTVPVEIPHLGDEDAKFGFDDALRSVLRSDPDVIMVGEIRDDETAQVVARAAQTGHLVLSTLHTNTAIGALDRLRELGVRPGPLSEVVEVIVAQRLVRKVCESCGERQRPTLEMLRDYEAPDEAIAAFEGGDSDWLLMHPRPDGCVVCGKTGYSGRTGIHEVILVSEDLRRAISKGADMEELRRIAISDGMVPLKMDAFNKVKDGITSLEEMKRLTK